MPNNPSNWIETLNQLPNEIIGALMAMFMAILRVVYGKEETKPTRVVLEGLICGLLSLTASSAITAMGLNVNWSVFVGGVIGYLGSATVRSMAISFFKKKIDKGQ